MTPQIAIIFCVGAIIFALAWRAPGQFMEMCLVVGMLAVGTSWIWGPILWLLASR